MKCKVKLFQDSSGRSFCIGYSLQEDIRFVDLQTIRPDPTLYLKKNKIYDSDVKFCKGKNCPKTIKIGEKTYKCV